MRSVDECGQCGDLLEIGVPHDCPVGGNVVMVEEGGSMEKAQQLAKDVQRLANTPGDADRYQWAVEALSQARVGKSEVQALLGIGYALLAVCDRLDAHSSVRASFSSSNTETNR